MTSRRAEDILWVAEEVADLATLLHSHGLKHLASQTGSGTQRIYNPCTLALAEIPAENPRKLCQGRSSRIFQKTITADRFAHGRRCLLK